MAIDSASKRFSMMNLGTVPTSPLFIPDGTVDDGDLYHLLSLYHGIALGSLTGAVLISQSKSVGRFIMSRIFGRVN